MSVNWVKAKHGEIPHGALLAGYEANGSALYVARAHHEGHWHPGKAGSHIKGCNISYGGKEHHHSEYEVLVPTVHEAVKLHWVKQHDFKDAVIGGSEHHHHLHIARIKHDGGVHLGKCSAHLPHGACIPYGGQEIVSKHYEVLVLRDNL